jgi:hypothetical protein
MVHVGKYHLLWNEMILILKVLTSTLAPYQVLFVKIFMVRMWFLSGVKVSIGCSEYQWNTEKKVPIKVPRLENMCHLSMNFEMCNKILPPIILPPYIWHNIVLMHQIFLIGWVFLLNEVIYWMKSHGYIVNGWNNNSMKSIQNN